MRGVGAVGMGASVFLIIGAAVWVLTLPHFSGGNTSAAAPLPQIIEGTPAPRVAPAPSAPTVEAREGPTAEPSKTDGVVSEKWLVATAAVSGIPQRALQGYAAAAIQLRRTDPICHLDWNTLAAIGDIESANGTQGGSSIDAGGHLVGAILGPILDGNEYPAVRDTDHGRLDGNSQWDRAVGPMQFLPSTWKTYGVDGNGDKIADPNQIDDAALTTADYLCASDHTLASASGWSRAIHSYNDDDAYVERVLQQANAYAKAAR